MAEFNPYKLEEEKWTPNNVYEILPPNAVSWSDYEFGQGTDNVDKEAANKSLIDGFVDFFKELFGTAGQILGGAIELGGAILGGFVNGVIGLIGGIANAIGSIFGGGNSESPSPPLFNPIQTNLEAAIKPHRDKIDESWQKTEEVLAEQEVLRGQMSESLQDMRDARDRANEAIEKSGQSIAEAQAASAAAETARQTLEAYNTALNQRITTEFNKAMGEAGKAITQAEAANSTLVTMNTQLGEITQQAADLNTKLGEHNQKFTDGLAAANSAIDEAKDLTATVKALAEENQAKVASAISKADKANADLALLSPKVTDAVEQAGQAVADVSALTPKVSAAQSRADSAYTAAENVRSEVTPKIEAAQTKGESALAVADKAVDWLRNPNEIGASLIAIDPETDRPNWAEHLDPVTAEENPLNLPNAYKTGDNSSKNPRPMFVNIDPSTEYMVSMWVKANKPGSVMTYDTRNQDGAHALQGYRKIPDFPSAGDVWRPYWIKDVPTEWTQYKKIATPRETSRMFRFAVSCFKHDSGETQDVVQYIADLQIYPLVPSQLDVDQAQNDAIRANSEILRQQDEINEAQRVANLAQKNFNDNQTKWSNGVDVALATQKTVNDNFKKWTDGATEAIEANKNAIKALNAPQIGTSIIPLIPGTETPVWQSPLKGLTRKISAEGDRVLPEKVPLVWRYGDTKIPAGGVETIKFPDTSFVAVDPAIEYEASWWTFSSNKNGNVIYVTLEDETGDRYIVEKVEDSEASKHTWGDPIRAIITPVNSSWEKFTTRFKFKAGTRFVRFRDIQFNNYGNAEDSYLYIADFRMGPKVPSQAQVDDAQNKAIKANQDLLVEQQRINVEQKKINDLRTDFEVEQKKINDKQTGINALNTKADSSLAKGLKALGKVALSDSLITHLEPSDQDVLAGTAKYDTPAWTAEFTFINPATDADFYKGFPGKTLIWRNKSRTTSETHYSGSNEVVAVNDQVEYKWSMWVSSTTPKVRFYATMEDENGNAHIIESGSHVTGNPLRVFLAVHEASGWTRYEGTFKFVPGTKFARLANIRIEPTYGGSSESWMWLSDLQIHPNIPSQAVVDELQDNAIRKNTAVGSDNKKAIEALRDGLDASIELETVNELISGLEDRIRDEEKARGRLQRKIDDLQNEMIPRTIVRDDATTYDDHVDLSGRKVTAKGSWVGQMAITYKTSEGYGTSSDPARYETHVTRKSVPDGTTRSWTLPGTVLRIDYWIYQGKAKSIELENSGGFFTGSTWEQSTNRTIASHKVGKTYGTGKIEWKTQLKNANRGTTYRLIVRVTGQADKTYTWSSVGPLTGLGSGTATLKFDYEFNLPDNATVSIVAYTNGSTAYRTMVNYSSGTLTYVEKK